MIVDTEEAKIATSNRIENREGNTVEEVKIDDSIASELFIGTIASPVEVNTISDSCKVILETNMTDVEYKINTGADANVISYKDKNL